MLWSVYEKCQLAYPHIIMFIDSVDPNTLIQTLCNDEILKKNMINCSNNIITQDTN
jgi:hypothetical protein